MKKFKLPAHYFTKTEQTLWISSILLILLSFLVFDRENYLTLLASLIGVTSLIFCAKGNPFGQFLMIVFSMLYGIISLTFGYYGEMITYFGMTMPMAVFSLTSWMKNPFRGKKAEVKVHHLNKNELFLLPFLTLFVTFIFYWILKYFHTANLLPSTLSVATSFAAVYLTFRRSPFYALAYAANDLVLILLWTMAALEETAYFSVMICFAAFFVNDLYGFINWKKIGRRQAALSSAPEV